jgi:signal peptidase I
MERKLYCRLVRVLARMPPLYGAVAFFWARRVTVRGGSMRPPLEPGDRILFDRLAYAARRPRRGEIVLARHPARPGLLMVKRIAAIPGETLATPDGPLTLHRGEYWLTGDAVDASTDSRQLGPCQRRDILAPAWLRYWPPERFARLG